MGKKDGSVAVFVGTVDSEAKLREAVRGQYAPSGKYVRSLFEIMIGVQGFDPDFFEASFRGDLDGTVADAIAPNSYSDTIVENLGDRAKEPFEGNAVALIYNFAYTESPMARSPWVHVGSVPYK